MQLLYMLAGSVAMTLWSPVPAAACSCVMMPVEQSIAEHPVILSGRLTKMDLLDRGDMIRLEIAVEQGFKGTSSQTTGVVSQLSVRDLMLRIQLPPGVPGPLSLQRPQNHHWRLGMCLSAAGSLGRVAGRLKQIPCRVASV